MGAGTLGSGEGFFNGKKREACRKPQSAFPLCPGAGLLLDCIDMHAMRPQGVEIRKKFPILDQMVRGKPLVYLDNAATTQKPAREAFFSK
jgi:hypothetical protein